MRHFWAVFLSGFLSAVLTDLHAWGFQGEFDWRKAGIRWGVGAFLGAVVGIVQL